MSHLSPERLAALSDDTPTPIEAAHLTGCDECTAELAAQRKLGRLAAAAQVVAGAPVSSFDALVPRLRAEGLVSTRDRAVLARRWALRAAAAVVLMAGGVIAGRVTTAKTLPFLPAPTGGADNVSPLVAATQLAASFKTPDDAIKTMSVAQQAYQAAAEYLAAQDTSSHFVGLNQTYRTRLAALDQMTAAARAGLYQAPQDPLLNQAFLATVGAREVTLRQIGQSLPTTRQLKHY